MLAGKTGIQRGVTQLNHQQIKIFKINQLDESIGVNQFKKRGELVWLIRHT